MTDTEKSEARFLKNEEDHCILEFKGGKATVFLESLLMILHSEAKHMQQCEDCAEVRNLTTSNLETIVGFTENALSMRGYVPQSSKEGLH